MVIHLLLRVHQAKCQVGYSQAGIDIQNINSLRYAYDTTVMAKSKEELKSLFMKVNGESEKTGFKLNIKKTKITSSSPITSRQADGEEMATVTDFILGATKITVNGDCSHKIKRHLFLGRKAMTNLNSILKKKTSFGDKGPYSQRYGFSTCHV